MSGLHRVLQQAEFYNAQGHVANEEGDFARAAFFFLRSSALAPGSARFRLSAANMKLKMKDAASIAEALSLYDSVKILDTLTTPLTKYQRAMLTAKRSQAELFLAHNVCPNVTYDTLCPTTS